MATEDKPITDPAAIELIRANMPVATEISNGLMAGSTLKGMQYKEFSLMTGQTAYIGKVCGLCVIRHNESSAAAAILYMNNYYKEVVDVAGRRHSELPIEFIWEGNGYSTSLSLKSAYNQPYGTMFYVAWQSIGAE